MPIRILESEQSLRLLAGQGCSVRVRRGARLVVLSGVVRMVAPMAYPGVERTARLAESEHYDFAENGIVVLESVAVADLLFLPPAPVCWLQCYRRGLSRLQAWCIGVVRFARSGVP